MKKDDKPLVSVVIVSYNNKEWLLHCIPSLLSQSYKNIEIIVVDNNSVDEAGEFVRKNFSDNLSMKLRARRIKVVKLEENRGFGAGANKGIREARGEYVLIANEDMIFENDYIEILAEVIKNEPKIAVCQGLTYKIEDSELSAYRQASRTLRQNFGRHKLNIQSRGLFFNYSGILTGEAKKKSRKQKDMVDIFSATVPMILDKEFFEAIEGFDEDFFLYFEEVDLCWRVWLNGRRVVYIPKAKAYHVGGMSTGKLSQEKLLEYSVRNRILTFSKNLGGVRLFIGLALQVLITSIAWLVYLFKGRFGYCRSICKAWKWNICQLRKTLAKRLRIQRSRVVEDGKLFRKIGGCFPVSRLRCLAK